MNIDKPPYDYQKAIELAVLHQNLIGNTFAKALPNCKIESVIVYYLGANKYDVKLYTTDPWASDKTIHRSLSNYLSERQTSS